MRFHYVSLLLLSWIPCSRAFLCAALSAPIISLGQRSSPLLVLRLGSESNNEDKNVELERQRLESMLGKSFNASESPSDTVDSSFLTLPYSQWKSKLSSGPAPPLLTAIGRERLETEIILLESLADSDAAISELWDLWYAARGPGPASQLKDTEKLVATQGSQAVEQVEQDLRRIVAEQGLYWPEPVNRLATLTFLQGRYQESKELCQVVLKVKPWHFGALSGIVLVCRGMKDIQEMVRWSQEILPPLTQPVSPTSSGTDSSGDNAGKETRKQWVKRMVGLAQESLREGQKGLERSFLGLDDDNVDYSDTLSIQEDDDAWQ